MKLIAIVREVPCEAALAAGPERSYALIGLAKATEEPDSAAQLIASGTVAGQPAAKADAVLVKGVLARLKASGFGAAGELQTSVGAATDVCRCSYRRL